MRSINGTFLRFIAWGSANTAVTYFLYLLMLEFFPYHVAYSITFAVGIVVGYSLYCRFVFRQPFSWRKMLNYPFVYLAQYVFGVLLLWLLVSILGLDPRIAPLLVIVLSVPATFWLTRRAT